MSRHRQQFVLILAAISAVACTDRRRGPSLKDRVAAQAAAASPTVPAIPVEMSAAICTDTSESAAMRCAPGAAMRAGDTIVLRLTLVGAAKRVDNPDEDGAYRRYYYAGRFGGDNGTPAFHILDVRDNAGGAIELINAATGDSLLLRGVPVLSPDGARFANIEEPDACELASQLEVWRVTGDRPVREFLLQPFDCNTGAGWGPSELSWHSRDTIALVRNRIPRDSARHANAQWDTTRALLVRDAGRWVIDSSAAAAKLAVAP